MAADERTSLLRGGVASSSNNSGDQSYGTRYDGGDMSSFSSSSSSSYTSAGTVLAETCRSWWRLILIAAAAAAASTAALLATSRAPTVTATAAASADPVVLARYARVAFDEAVWRRHTHDYQARYGPTRRTRLGSTQALELAEEDAGLDDATLRARHRARLLRREASVRVELWSRQHDRDRMDSLRHYDTHAYAHEYGAPRTAERSESSQTTGFAVGRYVDYEVADEARKRHKKDGGHGDEGDADGNSVDDDDADDADGMFSIFEGAAEKGRRRRGRSSRRQATRARAKGRHTEHRADAGETLAAAAGGEDDGQGARRGVDGGDDDGGDGGGPHEEQARRDWRGAHAGAFHAGGAWSERARRDAKRAYERARNGNGRDGGGGRGGSGANGWSQLWVDTLPITSFDMFAEEDALYAAGYTEGSLMADRIYQSYANVHQQWATNYYTHFDHITYNVNVWPRNMVAFLNAHMDWLAVTAERERDRIPRTAADEFRWRYWEHVRLITAQFDGLYAGYYAHCSPRPACLLHKHELLLLNLDGDMETLIPALLWQERHLRADGSLKRHAKDDRDTTGAKAKDSHPGMVLARGSSNATTTADDAMDVNFNEDRARLMTQLAELHKWAWRRGQRGGTRDGVTDEDAGSDDDHGIHHNGNDRDDDDDDDPRPHVDIELLRRAQKDFRCSALVRVADDDSDLFMGHDTWDSFGSMLRAFKYYDFSSTNVGGIGMAPLSFSSSPGFLSSVDDFYVTGRGLVVMETTNEFYDNDLYRLIRSEGVVLSWQRCMVATYMAESGQQWTDIFAWYNSGTYNNQWIGKKESFVDLKLFTPGRPIADNTLWVLEQLPDYVHAEDQSDALRIKRYWASYNIPFYPEVWQRSGYARMERQFGPEEFSHKDCARARIFARDAPHVQTMDDFARLMTYNDYQHDPLSHGDPRYAIMSRYDLYPSPAHRLALGGVDSKVTSWAHARNMSAFALNGPTHAEQPVFQWGRSKAFDLVNHFGQPTVFDYRYARMRMRGPDRSPGHKEGEGDTQQA